VNGAIKRGRQSEGTMAGSRQKNAAGVKTIGEVRLGELTSEKYTERSILGLHQFDY
jgi:hypothetical protein